jgi:hypothetical protein
MILTILFACTIDNVIEKIPSTNSAAPSIVITPESLNFGISEGVVQDVLTLSNEGDAALEVKSLHVEGIAFTLVQPLGNDLIAPGESQELLVQYEPVNMEDVGWVKIMSNDPAEELSLVPLNGATSAPLLILDPPTLDMGFVRVGEAREDGFTVRNEGTADLNITSELLMGTSFTLTDPLPLPLTLEPGEDTWINVSYAPPVDGSYTGTIWLESNTFGGVTQGQIIGETGAPPEAICSVNPEEVAPLYESATWYGDQSTSSSSPISEYEWSLIEKPQGSEAYIPNGGANRPNFVPDLAGTYVAQLVVHNEDGLASEPCLATLEAVPGQTLWIELSWEHSNDDMDLHLLRPGAGLNGSGDCYYANCVNGGLDWGVPGDPIDDPSLDLDDIPGTGPENINIYEPESGVFDVYVHDYPGSVYTSANDVHVRIFLSGVLAWEGTKTISGEDSFVRFAQVDWPSGTVTPF